MEASTKKKSGSDAHMSSIETVSNRIPERFLAENSSISVVNLEFGVNVYQNALEPTQCYEFITTLNNNLDGAGNYSWRAVEPDQSLRSAVDFSISESVPETEEELNKTLHKINKTVSDVIKRCIDDYSKSWGIDINHYEPLNYVKYSYPSDYFEFHIDHSPNSVRTVSGVLYLNDNYDGGELHFPRLDGLMIKPKAGDFVVFPSTYLYGHESRPMRRGTKYSVVAFTDYKERV